MVGLKRIITKKILYASEVMIGDSIFSGVRRYSTVWRNFILRCKTTNLEIVGDCIENVLWRINDIVLPKSIRSVVIHCGINNIDTSSSDKIRLGGVTIARSISHRYLNIDVIVSGLVPRDIHWSTRRVKINKPMFIWQTIAKNPTKWLSCARPRLDFARQLFKHGIIL